MRYGCRRVNGSSYALHRRGEPIASGYIKNFQTAVKEKAVPPHRLNTGIVSLRWFVCAGGVDDKWIYN